MNFFYAVNAAHAAAVSPGGIVTANLYQHYNASDAASYPGSGTTWYDLIGNYDLSLIGGPAYNATAPAHFDFDGLNDYARGGTWANTGNDFTIEAWARKDTQGSYRQTIAAAFTATIGNRRFLLNFEQNTGTARVLFWDTSNTLTNLSTSQTFGSGSTWYHITATKIGTTAAIYVNGALSNSTTCPATLETCDVFGIAERQLAAQDLLHGDVARCRVYSAGLTASEVLQNFDAEKAEFGY